MKKLIYFSFYALVLSNALIAQNSGTITTAVPFLLINPNAQAMGIADIGVVAASPYCESGLTQNPALLSRNERLIGLKLSYKPWLRHLVPDINAMDAGIHYAFRNRSAVAYSYNRFSLGNIIMTDVNGNMLGTYKAHEAYHSLRYAQCLTNNLSVGLGFKYVISDIMNNTIIDGEQTQAEKTMAADIGVDYRREVAKKENSFWRYDIGASITNMGSKINYRDTGTGDFIPTCISLGTMWTYTKKLKESLDYSIDLAYQCKKLLVPSPQPFINSAGMMGTYTPKVSVFKGAYQSFSDAPGGIREELAEIVHKFGIENRLVFNKNASIALRTGYFYEDKTKGDRKFLNLGIGGKLKSFYLDAAMILLYKQQTGFVSGFKYPFSWNLNVGYCYTFKV
ncbi:MAG: type IX secretion system outer membrane channel protein PorV [Bacteroidia bacterium]